jgi:deazaflavin-dependent oxidoreductase (nitroreductase family)
MDEETRQALASDRTIDMTTIGRTSGQPRRKEMSFFNFDGDTYITGTPGKRDWYANLLANPGFTFHLKQSVTKDLAATATPITDPDARRAIFTHILARLNRSADIDAWMANSPLVKVTFTGG